MPANKIQQAMVAQRRREALQLRTAGVDILTIGKRLAADPLINSQGLNYPGGYGSKRYGQGKPPPDDEALGRLVSEDLARSVKALRAMTSESAAVMRGVQAEQVDRLFQVAYRQGVAGDLTAIDRAVKLMDRKAKLLGLDVPVQTEVRFTDAELDEDIDQLLVELGVEDIADLPLGGVATSDPDEED